MHYYIVELYRLQNGYALVDYIMIRALNPKKAKSKAKTVLLKESKDFGKSYADKIEVHKWKANKLFGGQCLDGVREI